MSLSVPIKKPKCWWLLALMIAYLPLTAQRSIPRLEQLDVQFYTFYIDLVDITDNVRGKAVLNIKFLKDLESFTLDLDRREGPEELGMEVNEIIQNGEQIPYKHTHLDELVIYPPNGVKKGDEKQYIISYQGIPQDGLIISTNKYGDRTFFGDNWPNRAHFWLPCVDHPSDKAGVEFIVAAPDHYQVVANGVQVEEINLNDDVKLTHWREDTPIPMKVAVIGVARFGVQRAGEVFGIPVSSWVYRQDRIDGYADYSQAINVLAFFIQQIGPYPYKKLANVQSKTRYGGMENASTIFYFENSVTGKGEHESLIAHEIAHQWFGNSASELNWHHIWLSEGFATYGANLYTEHQYGRPAMAERLESERQQVVAYHYRNSRPIVDTSITDWNQLLNPNSYQKGSWVLHMLRREVGEAAFWDGLRTYYRQYAGKNALTADFQRIMEEVSGQQLDTFFQQWIFQPGHPNMKVSWTAEENGQLQVVISQQQEERFTFPLDFIAVDGQGNKQKQTVVIDKARQVFNFDLGFIPVKILLDPDTWLLYQAEISP